MSEASEIPSVLEVIKGLDHSDLTSAYPAAKDSCFRLTRIVNRLTQWYTTMQKDGQDPLWWRETRADSDSRVWFPHMTFAISLNCFWAFWLICVTQIRQLRKDYPSLKEENVQIRGHSPESEQLVQEIVQTAMRILQSIEFFAQDEMKLLGIAEASFPFRVATKALRAIGITKTHSSLKAAFKMIERASSNRYHQILLLWVS